MQVRVEFTTEPFHGEDDQLPAHVTAAADVLRYAGLSPDLGPLGTSVEGDAEVVVDAVARALKEALAHGATRVTLTLGDVDAAAPASADTGSRDRPHRRAVPADRRRSRRELGGAWRLCRGRRSSTPCGCSRSAGRSRCGAVPRRSRRPWA